jgi:hypothetical protein
LLAGARQVISKRLRSRSIDVGAAPEFTPKAELRHEPNGGWPADNAEMHEIGEEQVDYGRRRDTRFRHCAQSLLVLERLVARHAMVPAASGSGTHTGLDDVFDAYGRVR